MPSVKDVPVPLKPYVWHGVELQWGNNQASGNCPFCMKEGKFYVGMLDKDEKHFSGGWYCQGCREAGNTATFLRKLWDISFKCTPESFYEELAHNRGLLHASTLKTWGAARSMLDESWLLPAYGAGGKLDQLYSYRVVKGRTRLLATPEMGHGLYGVPLFDTARSQVHICEGPWDAMSYWEVIDQSRINVLATPSANVWKDYWNQLLTSRDTTLLYDNDHPTNNVASAGFEGMRRVAGLIGDKARSIHYLAWGPEGYDPDLPSGTDIRDLLIVSSSLQERKEVVRDVLQPRVLPVPTEWKEIVARIPRAASVSGVDPDCIYCDNWEDVHKAWRLALQWIDGLDKALSFGLACVMSTPLIGDQLWGKIVGPPSCGKTTIMEALAVNKRYTKIVSTLTGLHSGWKTDPNGAQDHSLISKCKDKCLLVKDADTLLKDPHRDQILAELRDAYDKTSRTHYKHGINREYDQAMTVLLAGTEAIRMIDESELGQRFLDVVVVDSIDEETERLIRRRAAHRAADEMCNVSDGSLSNRDNSQMVHAKQLTGGYLGYLRANVVQLVNETKIDSDAIDLLGDYGEMVSFLRSRPGFSRLQDETSEREMSYRLTNQLVRLARCLAVVYNRPRVDDFTLRRCYQIAMDTGRGKVLQAFRMMYGAGSQGVNYLGLAITLAREEKDAKRLLHFLLKIGAVDQHQVFIGPAQSVSYYRLSDRLRRLYERVILQHTTPPDA